MTWILLKSPARSSRGVAKLFGIVFQFAFGILFELRIGDMNILMTKTMNAQVRMIENDEEEEHGDDHCDCDSEADDDDGGYVVKGFRDPDTGKHIPFVKKSGITGTARYVTVNLHQGCEPSRRDDLGSIGYVLLYFLRGKLPWQGINHRDKKKRKKRIGKRKAATSHQDLCKSFPKEFVQYLEYCDSLGFKDKPDYDHLRSLFRKAASRHQLDFDWQFDWLTPRQKRKRAPVSGSPSGKVESSTYESYESYEDSYSSSRSGARPESDRGHKKRRLARLGLLKDAAARRWFIESGDLKPQEKDGVGVLTMNSPPVNSLGTSLVTSFKRFVLQEFPKLVQDPKVKAIVITGNGSMFSGGAEITELLEAEMRNIRCENEYRRQDAEDVSLSLFAERRCGETVAIVEAIRFAMMVAMGEVGSCRKISFCPEGVLEGCFLAKDTIDASPKTVVAALNGPALGGGCEVSLACHYRVAAPKASVGFPEVNLGLLPGAQGTQRLPRVAALPVALPMILQGRPMNAARLSPREDQACTRKLAFEADAAKKNGIIDVVAKGDATWRHARRGSSRNHKGNGVSTTQAASSGLASEVVDEAAEFALTHPPAPISKREVPKTNRFMVAAGGLEQALNTAFNAQPLMVAPGGIIKCFEAACSGKSFREGVAVEMEEFTKLVFSVQSAALRHLFLAERMAQKVPGVNEKPAPLKKIGILGAGLMGGGIAMCFVQKGVPVVLKDAKQEWLDDGMKKIQGLWGGQAKRGRLSQDKYKQYMSLLKPTLDYADFKDVDMVIEAVPEIMDLKKEVFLDIERNTKPDALICTNTSGLNIDDIAAVLKDPSRVMGTHFFSPANVMQLLENVRTSKSSTKTLATGMAMGKLISKKAIMVGNCDGFVGNRMIAPYAGEAKMVLEEGASIEQVDAAAQKFGSMAMGPMALGDLVGLELFWKQRKAAGDMKKQTKTYYGPYELTAFGQQAAYSDKVRKAKGMTPRAVSDEEICERLFFSMINEGFKILEEGYVARSSDIDLAYIYGYGFPPAKGGPMFYAENYAGFKKILERVKYYNEQERFAKNSNYLPIDYFEPSKLLEACAAKEGTKVFPGQTLIDVVLADFRKKSSDGVGVLTMNSPPVNSLGTSLVTSFKRFVLFWGSGKGRSSRNSSKIQRLGWGLQGMMDLPPQIQMRGKSDRDYRQRLDVLGRFAMMVAMGEAEMRKNNPVAALSEMMDTIDASPKTVVAALNGPALGGGCEVSLACHYRVAAPKASVGFPEVNLGLLPGAQGTQRLPRVAALPVALPMILQGRPMNADAAKKNGIIDVVAKGDVVDEAAEFALTHPPAPISKREVPKTNRFMVAAGGLEQALNTAFNAQPLMVAPGGIIKCFEAACSGKSFREGVAVEMEEFTKLVFSVQSAALRHLFLAERMAQKVPGVNEKPAPLKKIGILGAGLMGGGIAMCFVQKGVPVVLKDAKQEWLDDGMKKIQGLWGGQAKRGRLSQDKYKQYMSLLKPTLDYADFKDVDMVIEAVPEIMDLKKEVFLDIERNTKPDALICTNTSGLNIDDIAAVLKDPSRVMGTHFFSPANVMQLLENVRTSKSSTKTLATGMAMGKLISKKAIMVGNCDGFVGNRMLAPYAGEAKMVLEEGASIEQVDAAAQKFGSMAMGPMALGDLVGLELFWKQRKAAGDMKKQTKTYYGPYELTDWLCEQGRFGLKTPDPKIKANGRGVFIHRGRSKEVDPEVVAKLDEVRKAKGMTPRAVSDEEICERLFFSMINEGFKILEEGYVARSSDIDLAYIYGYGFPPAKGGPMFYAENYAGFKKILERVKYYNEQAKVRGSVSSSRLVSVLLLLRRLRLLAAAADAAAAAAAIAAAVKVKPADKDRQFNPSAQLALICEERFTKNSNYLPIDYFEPSKLLEACAAKEGTKAGLPSLERASPGLACQVFPGQTLIDVVLADFRKKSSAPGPFAKL
ncbi:Peroxisomal bifunctional enzyme [Symbiodinium microadriaticum]|uniref:Peroxisomal bifunctional enzyme n=1 Tax=Symbiodinium microadriaticum TaxID=2951 RepID=A0A1Q9CKU8_SYMMI|nr:Peroxisomal bifunctional enzyme [Symbiodinium microadriaticum]